MPVLQSLGASKGYVNAERGSGIAGPGKFGVLMLKTPKDVALHPIDEPINHLIA
jgi:hypothetical protein